MYDLWCHYAYIACTPFTNREVSRDITDSDRGLPELLPWPICLTFLPSFSGFWVGFGINEEKVIWYQLELRDNLLTFQLNASVIIRAKVLRFSSFMQKPTEKALKVYLHDRYGNFPWWRLKHSVELLACYFPSSSLYQITFFIDLDVLCMHCDITSHTSHLLRSYLCIYNILYSNRRVLFSINWQKL